MVTIDETIILLAMKQIFHCPYKPFGRPLTIVLEMVPGIPLKGVSDMSLLQELLLTADGRGDGRQNGRARALLTIAETEIEGTGLRLMSGGIVEPILIPHRWRSGHNSVERLVGLIASPQREESCQGVAANDDLHRSLYRRGQALLFLSDNLPEAVECLSCAIAEGRLAKDGWSWPGSQLVKPPVDMNGDETEIHSAMTDDPLHLSVQLLTIMLVDGLQ